MIPVIQTTSEPFLVKIDFSTKVEDLTKIEGSFEQGDTLLFIRAHEFN
jgi:hypothetical protein